ncbi:MAG: potassium transporter TrkA, partial [Anaerolineales bacterium]
MTSLISLLVVVTVSLIATRIATIALTLTGLSYDAAYFQALSAFSGVGYTTGESEDIVKHPVRRRIIAVVILIGNIGLVTAVASLLLTFVDAGDLRDELLRAGLILAGLAVIWYLFTNRLIDDISSRLIRRLLQH